MKTALLALLLMASPAMAQRLLWTYSPPLLPVASDSIYIPPGYAADALGNAALIAVYSEAGHRVGSRFTWLNNRGAVRASEEFVGSAIPMVFRISASSVTILISDNKLRKYTLVRGKVSTVDFDIQAGTELLFGDVPQVDPTGFFLVTGQNGAAPEVNRYAK